MVLWTHWDIAVWNQLQTFIPSDLKISNASYYYRYCAWPPMDLTGQERGTSNRDKIIWPILLAWCLYCASVELFSYILFDTYFLRQLVLILVVREQSNAMISCRLQLPVANQLVAELHSSRKQPLIIVHFTLWGRRDSKTVSRFWELQSANCRVNN